MAWPARAVVCGVIQETADARSLVLDVVGEPLRYRSGQYLTIQRVHEQALLRRCYSFSSAPEVDARPTVTVKRVPGGAMSNWLHDGIGIGDTLQVGPPPGGFTLDPDELTGLLLVGAGSGITPLMSLLKAALARTTRAVRLFYANHSPQDEIFRQQLELLVSNHAGRLEVVHHYDVRDGLPSERRIADVLHGFERATVYLCGPGRFAELVERGVLRACPRVDLRVERFSAQSPVCDPLPPLAAVAARVSWLIDRQLYDFECLPGETLLEAARRAGHDPPASCEAGYCGSCAAKLESGRVTQRVWDALNERKRREGWVLPCQACPATPELMLVTRS